jgi:hypothetical protein
MDDRQTKIVEGAGLEESRLNTEFIEWLNVWGFRILVLLLVVAAGWAGYTQYSRWQEDRTDTALRELNDAVAAGSPDGLEAVAREWRSKRSVWEMATINAAEIHHEAGRLRLTPGGDSQKPEDRLTNEQVGEHLTEARALFTEVVNRSRGRAPTVLSLTARSGLAAVALTDLKLDEAKAILADLATEAGRAGYPDLQRRALERLATVDQWQDWPGPPPYVLLKENKERRGPIAMFGETPENFKPAPVPDQPGGPIPAQPASEGTTDLLGPFGGIGSEQPPAEQPPAEGEAEKPTDEAPPPSDAPKEPEKPPGAP